MIRGVDVSAYQPKLDYDKMRKAGCEFLIVKVTDGNHYTNRHAAAQIDGGIKSDMLVTLYHFGGPSGPASGWLADAAHEAMRLDKIADEIEQKYSRKIFTWLDLERNTALNQTEKKTWSVWADEVRRWSREEGQRKIGFYSGKYFTADLSLNDTWSQTLFWMAQYRKWSLDPNLYTYGFFGDTSRPPETLWWPKATSPFPRADIWQDGGGGPGGNNATFPGVGNDGDPSDTNLFAGDRGELEALIDAAA